MYAGAVSIAGLQRVLADAPVTQANIEVSTRLDPEDAEAADRVVTPEVGRALGDGGGPIPRSARSDTFARHPPRPESCDRPLRVRLRRGPRRSCHARGGGLADPVSA